MSLKFVVLVYVVVPQLLAVLTYASVLDSVGQTLAFIAGACMAALFDIAFLNMLGLPIRWK